MCETVITRWGIRCLNSIKSDQHSFGCWHVFTPLKWSPHEDLIDPWCTWDVLVNCYTALCSRMAFTCCAVDHTQGMFMRWGHQGKRRSFLRLWSTFNHGHMTVWCMISCYGKPNLRLWSIFNHGHTTAWCRISCYGKPSLRLWSVFNHSCMRCMMYDQLLWETRFKAVIHDPWCMTAWCTISCHEKPHCGATIEWLIM